MAIQQKLQTILWHGLSTYHQGWANSRGSQFELRRRDPPHPTPKEGEQRRVFVRKVGRVPYPAPQRRKKIVLVLLCIATSDVNCLCYQDCKKGSERTSGRVRRSPRKILSRLAVIDHPYFPYFRAINTSELPLLPVATSVGSGDSVPGAGR